jgi:hypothetical protein
VIVSSRKTAARAIVLAVVPVIVGTCSDPLSDRDLAATWWRGAAICTVAGLTAWAIRELEA